MSIEADVMARLKEAMKAKDADATRALRNIRAALLNERKKSGADALSDDEAVAVLRRMHKQLTEGVEAYEAAGRADLAASERAERAVVEAFLPRLADEATTRGWVAEAIAATGATSAADLGKVMGALMKAHRGELDGRLANAIARELLA